MLNFSTLALGPKHPLYLYHPSRNFCTSESRRTVQNYILPRTKCFGLNSRNFTRIVSLRLSIRSARNQSSPVPHRTQPQILVAEHAEAVVRRLEPQAEVRPAIAALHGDEVVRRRQHHVHAADEVQYGKEAGTYADRRPDDTF